MVHCRILCQLVSVMLCLFVATYAKAQVAAQLYYSGHMNEVHDAAGDMKHAGLHVSLPYAAGGQGRILFEVGALTPPNGGLNPIAGKKVRGLPSNQKDTYFYSLGVGRQFLYGETAMYSVDVRLGRINGHAERVIRSGIERMHRLSGLTNLRHSPASSSARGLLEVTVMHGVVVYRPHRLVALNMVQALTVGSLENVLVAGGYVGRDLGSDRVWLAGVRQTNWMPRAAAWYAGVFGRYMHSDLVTRYAGTRHVTSYWQAGVAVPVSRLLVSVKLTQALQPVVARQYMRADRYVEFALGASF